MKIFIFFVSALFVGDFFFGMMTAPFCQGHAHIALLLVFNAVWIYYLNTRILRKV